MSTVDEAVMKAITVQQPWAWAIIHGGKDVENRTAPWKYRGPLAIHAGTRWSRRGSESPLIRHDPARLHYTGAIIGIVELVDVHYAEDGCCDSPWAERSYLEHDGRVRKSITHLVLADPYPITPYMCHGKLGLWDAPAGLLRLSRNQ